jgi:hypothetical protein
MFAGIIVAVCVSAWFRKDAQFGRFYNTTDRFARQGIHINRNNGQQDNKQRRRRFISKKRQIPVEFETSNEVLSGAWLSFSIDIQVLTDLSKTFHIYEVWNVTGIIVAVCVSAWFRRDAQIGRLCY